MLIYDTDAAALKEMTIANLETYLNANLSFTNATNTTYTLTTGEGGGNDAIISLTPSDGSGTDTVTIEGTSGEIEVSETVTDSDGATIHIGLPSNVDIDGTLTVASTTTLNGDVNLGSDNSDTITVKGNLIVDGTTTTVNSTTLEVEDRFITMASGSAVTTDGGIVVQQGVNTGYGLGFEGTYGGWVLQNNIGLSANTITADAYVGVIQRGTGDGAGLADPTYGGASGQGTIYIDTDDEEIWIYA
jgi:hypothetical protein